MISPKRSFSDLTGADLSPMDPIDLHQPLTQPILRAGHSEPPNLSRHGSPTPSMSSLSSVPSTSGPTGLDGNAESAEQRPAKRRKLTLAEKEQRDRELAAVRAQKEEDRPQKAVEKEV